MNGELIVLQTKAAAVLEAAIGAGGVNETAVFGWGKGT